MRCNFKECVGCGVCIKVCKRGAISFYTDSFGFNVVKIDEDKCNFCGACALVCPSIKNINSYLKFDYFTLWDGNLSEAMKSRSGGAFNKLASYLVKKGYVIYGAASTSPFKVEIIKSFDEKKLSLIRGVKYLQPSIDFEIYDEIKCFLKNGRGVLYSGLPCHCQALLNYLNFYNVSTEKLVTVDLICHGVPSSTIQKEYIDYVEKKEKSKVIEINYRDKTFGWEEHIYSMKLENGKIVYGNILTILFSKSNSLNEACFSCKYTTVNRHTSLTLGDFWKASKYFNNNFDFRKLGISICFCRDPNVSNYLKSNSNWETSDKIELSDAIQFNLLQPTNKPFNYNDFKMRYNLSGFSYVLHYALPLKRRIKRCFIRLKCFFTHERFVKY